MVSRIKERAVNNIDRLLIGALVLGVWVLVAMQFFGLQVEVTNWPYQTNVTGGLGILHELRLVRPI